MMAELDFCQLCGRSSLFLASTQFSLGLYGHLNNELEDGNSGGLSLSLSYLSNYNNSNNNKEEE